MQYNNVVAMVWYRLQESCEVNQKFKAGFLYKSSTISSYCVHERENILDTISFNEDYFLTTDFWTLCQNCSYGTIIIHYVY